MKTVQLSPRLWRFTGTDMVNVFLLRGQDGKDIVIDAGNSLDRKGLSSSMAEVVDPSKVDLVVFTHLHYDHRGNADLFTGARFYASEEEIEAFRKGKLKVFADEPGVRWLSQRLEPLPEGIAGLQVIPAPGHTAGGVLLWYAKEGILFTGDTYFREGVYGRDDLPTASPDDMEKSIKKVRRLPVKILCAGHQY